uniref:Neuropeptide n=1 Tax=Haemonchus contortus TaxID=6289 RepID=A0A7I4YW30_HAECO
MLARLLIFSLIVLSANVQGLLFGCEVLNACNGEVSCVSSLVSRLKLEYCLRENEESLNKRAGGGKFRMRDILLNSYLNRV